MLHEHLTYAQRTEVRRIVRQFLELTGERTRDRKRIARILRLMSDGLSSLRPDSTRDARTADGLAAALYFLANDVG